MRIALSIGLLLLPPIAGVAAAQAPERPVTLSNTEYREFTSKITGRPYAVFVALPDSYKTEPSKRYPVLYTTDSHIAFPLTTEIYRLMRLANEVPEMVLVSVAGTDPEAWAALRFLELTPTRSLSLEEELTKSFGQEVRSGDAAGFLRMVNEELIPDVERRYRVTQERIYSGHSLGALFGIYSLFQAPQTFTRMLLVSPALYWDDQVMFKEEAKFAAAKRPLRSDVFIGVGGLESTSMQDYAKHFVSVVTERKHNGLTLHSLVFENETHTSVFPAAFARGLRVLFPKPAEK